MWARVLAIEADPTDFGCQVDHDVRPVDGLTAGLPVDQVVLGRAGHDDLAGAPLAQPADHPGAEEPPPARDHHPHPTALSPKGELPRGGFGSPRLPTGDRG